MSQREQANGLVAKKNNRLATFNNENHNQT